MHPGRSLLRFITCGSVDAGKSTLIGRLRYESKRLFEDQCVTLDADGKERGSHVEARDFAQLVDGLSVEGAPGPADDLAYPFFSTDTRTFIAADTPSHEHTRNLIAGASAADFAVVLVDARKGVRPQTRRDSYLVSLLGIRQIAVAINKMDLVDSAADVFASVERDYREFAARIGLTDITCIPISALYGHNIAERAGAMPWYRGPTLMDQLHHVAVRDDVTAKPFRLPVEQVNQSDHDVRGFAGTIVSGTVRTGDGIRVLPSGRQSTVARILVGERDVDTAAADQSVTVTLTDDIDDVSRGDVIAASDAPPAVADQFEATVVWTHDQPMLRGRSYLMKIGVQSVRATVAPLKYTVNVNTLEHVAATKLERDEIGVCGIELGRPVVFEPFSENHDLGGFTLVDRITNAIVGAGMLHFALRRSQNVHWQALDLNKSARAEIKGQKPCVVWFTGLSGGGKSTIANVLEKRLYAFGCHTYLLDGDNVRHGLNKDLGFTDADRVENIRRVAEVSRLMVDAGLIVLISFISPFRAERRMARELLETTEFVEVFVDTPLAVAEQRDPKGLYKKARRGELKNFTGVDSPYEAPEHAEVRVDTTRVTPEQAADLILQQLQRAGIVRPE